jgi:hypothetical protein
MRTEPCRECEFPVVSMPSGSVNGGYISFGCARCSWRKLEALNSGEAMPRWAHEAMPTMEETQARAVQLRATLETTTGPTAAEMKQFDKYVADVSERRISEVESEKQITSCVYCGFSHGPCDKCII